MHDKKKKREKLGYKRISVLSKRQVGRIQISMAKVPHPTEANHYARNEMDTHADTSCAGSNWTPLEFTGEICEVSPFLNSYKPVSQIPVAKCCTVWMDKTTSQEYLLVGDQMLWFGSSLEHTLINPNQIRAYGIPVYDDPFQPRQPIGIDSPDVFIPFDTTGTLLHFESRVPTEWDKTHLPIILLTDILWNPVDDVLNPGQETREVAAMREIHSLVSSASTGQLNVMAVERQSLPVDPDNAVETCLGEISSVFDERTFCTRLIDAVQVASTYRKDIDDQIEARKASGVITNDRHSKVGPEELSQKWNIGLQTAKDTFEVTTQHGVRTAIHPMTRRLRVDHLNLHRPRLRGKWFMDTVLSKVKSKSGNTCANVFTQGKFTKVIPMRGRTDAAESLIDFTDDVGIPEVLMTDQAAELSKPMTDFVKETRRMRIRLLHSEQGRKNQNHAAEREIGTLAKRWKLRMTKKKVPKVLWDFGLVYEGEILTRIARGRDRRTGYEEVTGQTPEIGEWLDFEFYDLVWWWDRPTKPNVTDEPRRLARWLGVSHRVGSDLCYWLITESGHIISKSSVEHVTRDDYLEEDKKKEIEAFNKKLEEKLDDTNSQADWPDEFTSMFLEDMDEDYNSGVTYEEENTPTDEEYDDMITEERPEADDAEELLDKYLNAELILDLGSGTERRGRVIKRSRGLDGEAIGRAHANPLFDTREYDVEFLDGSVEKYQANVIAENMFAQIDDEGRQFLLLDEIVDHKKNPKVAIPISEGTYRNTSGTEKPKVTTRGWELLVQWKDGSTSWEKLKDIKESNPIEVAEYAVANRIAEEPAFKWWVPYTIRRRNRIVKKVKSRYWRTTHQYGIKLPHSVAEALEIDRQTGTTFWQDALKKDMEKVKVAWKAHEDHTPEEVRSGKIPQFIGYQEIGCHIVFSVKMDFTRKCRMVAGGHTTETPSTITYSSVVSRDSVRLAFLIAGLNTVDIMSCDLQNAYLNAKCREKIWFEGGLECGEDRGKVLIVVRALYGLKSAGAAWRSELASALRQLKFESTKADPDVWIRTAARDDGFQYYEMLFVYVDDILAISHKAREVIAEIEQFYTAKPGSVKEPEIYLGAEVMKHQLQDGRVCWATSPRKYIENALKVVEQMLQDDGEGAELRKKAANPFPSNYKPELDVTEELEGDLASRYLQLIGILRWAIELGRIDIFHEVAIMSQYQASPRIGHLETLYHIFAYLKSHKQMGKIAYDAKTVDVDEGCFHPNPDWTEFYGEVEEELPPKMPKPLGNPVTINAFVDANHANNVITRRSHTGILIFVQNAPIIWYSKRQNTVESSTFGSEFIALRICFENLQRADRQSEVQTQDVWSPNRWASKCLL